MRILDATLVLCAAASLAATGCKKKEPADQAGAGTATAAKVNEAVGAKVDEVAGSAAKVADKVGNALKEGDALTPEAYEKLVLALASCEVKDDYIDSDCAAKKALEEAGNRTQTISDFAGQSAALGRKLIGHESPAVRLYAAGLMASVFGTDDSSQNALVEAAKKEQHTGVLRSILDTVANDGGKNPAVAELLLASAKHPDAQVRLKAVYSIASSWNKTMKGQIETLADLAAHDSDGEVRAAACKYGGKLGNDAFMPTLEKGTADPKADPDYYGACMEGLMSMWVSYPFFENQSEQAYKLMLRRLAATPRSENAPPWGIYGDIEYLADGSHDSAKKWLDTHPWFKPADLRKALGGVISDPAANWMGRTGALKAAVAMGATKAELTKWRKAYGDSPDSSQSQVTDALDEAIAAAK